MEWPARIRTQDRVFVLCWVVEVEELSCTKCKHHTLVVFLELIVDLGGHESGELTSRERLILVKRLTMSVSAVIPRVDESGGSIIKNHAHYRQPSI